MAVNNNEREGLLAIGTLLSNGKYRIEQYLSSGGFGNTYVATDLAFDEKVAIKELYIKGVSSTRTAHPTMSWTSSKAKASEPASSGWGTPCRPPTSC